MYTKRRGAAASMVERNPVEAVVAAAVVVEAADGDPVAACRMFGVEARSRLEDAVRTASCLAPGAAHPRTDGRSADHRAAHLPAPWRWSASARRPATRALRTLEQKLMFPRTCLLIRKIQTWRVKPTRALTDGPLSR